MQPETLPLPVELGLPLLEPEMLELVLGIDEGEGLPEGQLVGLALWRSEPVALEDVLRDRVGEPLREPVVLLLALREKLALCVRETPAVTEGDWLAEALIDAQSVPLGLSEALTLPEELLLLLSLPLTEAEVLGLAEPEALRAVLGDEAPDAVRATERVAFTLRDGVRAPLMVGGTEGEDKALAVRLALLVLPRVLEVQPLLLGETSALAEALAEGLPATEAEGESVAQPVPVPVAEAEPVDDPVPLPLPTPVAEAVDDPVPVPLPLPVEEAVPASVCEPLAEPLGQSLPPLLALLEPEGAPLALLLPETEEEAPPLALAPPLTVAMSEPLPPPVAERSGETETLAQRLELAVAELEAQVLRERVAQAEGVEKGVREVQPVNDNVPLELKEPLALLEPEDSSLAAALMETEGEPLPDAEMLAVPLIESVSEAELVLEAVAFGDTEAVRAPLPVRVTVEDCDLLTVPHRLTVGLRVTEGHTLSEGVPEDRDVALTLLEELLLAQLLAEPEASGDVEGAAEGVLDWLGEPEPEGLPPLLPVARGLLREEEGETERDRVGEVDALGQGVIERVRVTQVVALRDRVTLTEAVGLRLRLGEAVPLPPLEILGQVVALGEPVAEEEPEAEAVAEAAALAEPLAVAEPEEVAEGEAVELLVEVSVDCKRRRRGGRGGRGGAARRAAALDAAGGAAAGWGGAAKGAVGL